MTLPIKTPEDLEVTDLGHHYLWGVIICATEDGQRHVLKVSATTGLLYVDIEEKEDE